MRKIYSLSIFFLFLLGFSAGISGQVLMHNGKVTTCGGIFYDSGGKDDKYDTGEDYVMTLCSDEIKNHHITLKFDILDLGSSPLFSTTGDELFFFDGDNTSAPLLASFKNKPADQNVTIQASVNNPTGCITIKFHSIGRLFGSKLSVGQGWAANIVCGPACQSIVAIIDQATPAIVPKDTGWINVCPGQTTVNFKSHGQYRQNGILYSQNDVINRFEWNFGDGTPVAYGTDVTHVFEKSGGFNTRLTIVDTAGCSNVNYINQRVRVATKPTFSIGKLPSQVCAGTEIKLKAKANIIDTNYVVSVKGNTGSFNATGIRSGRLFIPDDGSHEYKTSIRFTDFPPGQTMTNVNEILGVFVNMEHSFARDLGIKLVCPSQKSVILHQYDFNTRGINRIKIGIPNDSSSNNAASGSPLINDSTYNKPGQGLSYQWVVSGASKTWRTNTSPNYSLPAGNYQAEGAWSNLVGCPLNGEWSLVVNDFFKEDNGWIFAWGINFKALTSSSETFTPNITEHTWASSSITTALSGDDMTVKPLHAGAANVTYKIKDDFGCTFDSTFSVKVLPPTSLACMACNIDTFFNTLNDTLICASNNKGVLMNKTPKKSANTSVIFEAFPNAIIDATTNPILTPYTSKLPVTAISPATLTSPLTQIDSVCFDIGTIASNDLVVELQSPTGQKLQLFNQYGAASNLKNICFSPKGTRNIATSTNPYSGVYQVQGGAAAWSGLNGSTIEGDWELHVGDAKGVDKDTVKRWSITFINQNGFKYAWTPATNLSCTNCATPKATPSVTTTYTVVVTDSTGCTHTDDIKITVLDSLPKPVLSVQNTNFTFIIFEWLPVASATGYEVSVNNGAWIPANGTLTHRVTNLKIGDVVNFKVRAISGVACGAKIDSLIAPTRACVASVGNGFNRRIEVDSILCYNGTSPRVNFAYANGIPPLTYIIDSLSQPNLGIFIDKIRAGQHTATVVDSAGCRDSIKFLMYHPAPLAAKLTAFETKCNGEDNGKVTVVGSGGVGNFNYRITGSVIGEWRNTAVFDSLYAGTYQVELRDGNGCLFDDQISVKSPPLFHVDLVKQDIRCFGEKSGVANALGSGGTQPYNWTWNNGKKTERIDSLGTGNYAVTVTDKNGCFFADDVTIDENLEIILTAKADSVTCYGLATGRAQILATGGLAPYIYQWSNAYFGDDNANIKAGNYKVTVTDGLGCVKKDAVNIFQPDSLRFDSLVTVNTLCPNDATGTATAYAKGGTTPYMYEWNNANQKTQKAVNLKAGPYSVTVKDAKGCFYDGDVTVKSNSAIVVDKMVLVTPLRCNGNQNATLQASVSGGVGSYKYAWSTVPIQTTADANNLKAGNYKLTVTDANNCSIVKDTTISEPQKLDAGISVFSDVKCKGEANGTATPSVSGGTPFASGLKYLFKWNDANKQETAIATDLVAGNYTLTVTDLNGCTDTANVVIKEPVLALTTKIQQTKLACFNQNNGEATAISTGGLGSYIYQWNNLQRTQVAINLSKQRYFVTVSDINGCQAIDSLDLKTYDSIKVAFTPVNPTCFSKKNGSVSISSITGGGGNGVLATYSYRWNTLPIQTTPSVTGLAGNRYYEVSIVDSKGCETIASQTLTDPNPITIKGTAKDVSCFGGRNGEAKIDALGDNPPFAFQWDAAANAQSTQTALNLALGTYKVTITDRANCSVDTSLSISQPTAMKIASQQVTDTKCTDETTGKIAVTIAGGKPNYVYSWSNGTSLNTITNLKSGRYDLVVTDANGCQLQEVFTVKTPNALDGDVMVKNAKCYGEGNGVISIDAFGGTQPYVYSVGGTVYNGINQVVGIKAGKYEVYVKDANGCKWFDQVEVTQPSKFLITATQDLNLSLGDSILLSVDAQNNQGTVQYSWLAPYDKTLSCVKCPTPMSKPMYTITYAVTGIDSVGCRATDSVKVTVVKPRYVLVPTAFTPNQDNVNDILAVRGKNGTKILVFKVFDRWGELLYEAQNFNINDLSTGWDGNFRGQPMTSGVYVWYIEAEYIDGAKEILKGNTSIIR